MKIFYHHRTLGDGAEGIHVAEIVKAFRQLEHEVRVISLIGESTNSASRAQSRWTRVARLMPGFIYELGEIAYNVHGYLSLSRAVRDYRPDVIYDRYVSYNYSAVGVGRRYGIPVVLEVNSPYSFQKQTFDETLYFRYILRCFERKICRDATWVVVVSTPLKKFLASIGVPPERIVVMPNGTDPDVFHPDIDGQSIRQQYGLNGKIVIGFCGILRPWHGLEVLLQAFADVLQGRTNLHLLIVGDGPSRGDLERLLQERGLARHVTITGRQPHERVRSFVAAMDIAVSPRATFYASPMKILEYMGMAKAIIAPDMENIRDILTHEHDSILFRPEDAGSLAKGLEYLIADIDVRKQLGQAARRKIVTERTWLHNAQDVIRLIAHDVVPM
jgi:glycosyltransferase involved in cell wall biosynthesis